MTHSQATHRPKVLIIGLDGATFDLIKPWAGEGKLPTIARLLRTGAHGELTSTIPPVTAPAWTSFMTGKNPGKHGLYNFVEPQPRSYAIRYTNARSRLAKTIWQLLSESGMRVGVINVPMTYPPERVNGYMISGRDAPEGSTAITYPPELHQEIEDAFGKVSPQIHYLGYLKTDQRRDALLNSLGEIDDHYLKLTGYLMQRYPVDVAMVVFTSTDTVQHFFWHYMDRRHPQYDQAGAVRYGEAILKVYQKVDDIIEKLTAELPEDTTVILLSDHGFQSTSARVIHLNRYLADLGLLKLSSTSQKWNDPGSLIRAVIKKADTFLRGSLTPYQKAIVARFFATLRNKWESHSTGLSNIDWSNTTAYSYEVMNFPPSIWINLKGLRPHGTVDLGGDYEQVVRFVSDKLYELKDPVSGEQLIPRIYRKDEIYHGPYLDHAPDLTLGCWHGMTFVGKPSFTETGREPVVSYTGSQPLVGGEWSGTHASEGIVVLWGKSLREGKQLAQAEIIDLAPTLLYILGLPIPEEMDGRVLYEAFKEQYTAVHHVLRRVVSDDDGERCMPESTYSDEEAAGIENRLRGLGYIE